MVERKRGVRPSGQTIRSQHESIPETTVQALLADAKDTPFGDPESQEVSNFRKTHLRRLEKVAKGRSEEFLHELAVKKGRDELGPYAPFLQWVVKEYKQLLAQVSIGGYTPFNLALYRGNDEFVQALLENVDDATLLCGPADDRGYTSLHLAIEKSSPFATRIIEKADALLKASAATNATSEPGAETVPKIFNLFKATTKLVKKFPDDDDCGEETPLHLAVNQDYAPTQTDGTVGKDPTIPEKSGDQRPAAIPSITNGLPQSPISTGFPRRPTFRETDNLAAKAKDPKERVGPRSALGDNLPERDAWENVSVPPAHLLDIVKLLIRADERVLVDCQDEDGFTPFRARLYHLDNDMQDDGSKESEARRHDLIQGDPIARYIREYCVNNFTRKDSVTALYEPGKERHLEFDLSGFPYPINAKFLKGLSQVLRFEGLLTYVSLPRLEVSVESDAITPSRPSTEERRRGGRNASATGQNDTTNQPRPKEGGKGSSSLCTIFDWLRAQQVKYVREVIVSDEAEPPHSDEAIEKCVEGLDIKVWNWQKVDLSSEVIVRVAPNAEEVTLCASGNNAVLVGWSGPSGLPLLKNLTKVHLLVRQGLESPARLETNIAKFETALAENLWTAELMDRLAEMQVKKEVSQTPNNQSNPSHPAERLLVDGEAFGKFLASIDEDKNRRPLKKLVITHKILRADQSFSSVYTESRIKMLTESPWMKCMKDFAGFLHSIKLRTPLEPVRIAVIDDGINMALDIFDKRVQFGESFHQLSQLSGRRGAYYVPSGPHGTLMAQLICEICPPVKLYIAQLEELRGQDGRRSFTAESAVEAIQWATRQNVDIISMSWSIDSNTSITELDKALTAAEEANIIMFCASIDRGPTVTDQTYPGRNKNCIKIGASTAKGNRLTWVSKEDSDFLAPGEGIQPAETHLWSQQSEPFGSSVSTALAAGLAGVLLYCDRLLLEKPKAGERYKEPVDLLRLKGNMQKVFSNIAKGESLFLEVTDYFPQKVGRDKWEDKIGHDMTWSYRDKEGTTKTKQVIQDLMTVVKHKIPVTAAS